MPVILKNLSGLVLFSFLLFGCKNLSGQKFQSDNADGTYTNPIIFADFPDPDVICVDSVYYMVSTTMFVFPGVTILRSYDLVNWEYCSNAVPRMDFSKCYNLDSCSRYGHGQWATSFRYHEGIYYLLFITLDEGGFVCTASDPGGPWELRQLPRGFYDPGLFFDEDGRIYVIHGYNDLKITELNADMSPRGQDKPLLSGDIRPGLEGTHVYKVNGFYYLYCTYGGGDGFQVAFRSRNIYGPYEEKIVIQDSGNMGTGIHQGALVQTINGEWWSVIFQDGGPFGRFPTLQPVEWIDGWPMVGKEGKGVITYAKPDVGRSEAPQALPVSDEFNSVSPGMQWGWNHNPDDEHWSLTENPGFLRLYTCSLTNDLTYARNTLTQRIFAYYSKDYLSSGTIKIDVGHMAVGDIAGLAVFQDPYAFIGLKKLDRYYEILMVKNGQTVASIPAIQTEIYLRACADYASGEAGFFYSYDNREFLPLGNILEMQFNLSVFTGNKFAIFNFATEESGGYTDIDWFHAEPLLKK